MYFFHALYAVYSKIVDKPKNSMIIFIRQNNKELFL